jgi:hypothetical protein
MHRCQIPVLKRLYIKFGKQANITEGNGAIIVINTGIFPYS